MTKTCTQCGARAELFVRWLAKHSEKTDVPQQALMCEACLSLLWSRFSNTQFGQTVQIEPLGEIR